MAAAGRILQVIGWLAFIAGFAGPALGYESVSPIPGLILIFIARMLRSRARSEMPPGPAGKQTEPQPQPVETPPFQPRQQAPAPTRHTESPSIEAKTEPKQERPVDERNQLLERIALAGRDAAEEPAVPEPEELSTLSDEKEPLRPDEARTPMSSAEMIARARERWDRD